MKRRVAVSAANPLVHAAIGQMIRSPGLRFMGTLRGSRGGGVGGLNAHNKDLIRPINGSIVPYPLPPDPP